MIKGKGGWDCARLAMQGAECQQAPCGQNATCPCALLCPVPRLWGLPGLNSLVHHSSVVYEGGSNTAAQNQKLEGSDGLSFVYAHFPLALFFSSPNFTPDSKSPGISKILSF